MMVDMYWCCGKRRSLPAAPVRRAPSTDARDAPREGRPRPAGPRVPEDGEWATSDIRCSLRCSPLSQDRALTAWMQTRIAAMNKFVEVLKTKREIIVNVLRIKGWAATGDKSVS